MFCWIFVIVCFFYLGVKLQFPSFVYLWGQGDLLGMGGGGGGMIASGNFVPQLQVQIYPPFYYMFDLDYYGVSIHNTHYLAMIKLTSTHS